MRLLGLISGGKDSIYTLYKASAEGHEVVALGQLTPQNGELDTDSYMYQTVCSNIVPSIAKCLDLPIFTQNISRKSLNTHSLDYIYDADDEVEELYTLIDSVKTEIRFEGVSTGAICSEYQKRRVNNVCDRLDLETYHPLWMKDQVQLLDEIIKSGQQSILVKTSSLGLNKQHIGKSLNELYSHFMDLYKKHKFNVCGEGGEYETITLDSPIYKRRLNVNKWEIVETSTDPFAPSILYIPKEWEIVDK